ncbi:murein hydrolase activator EnvC family protein [Helicobacter brantae]|uniref:M23ase beta-sheet core domain-containing protein n=1 Tax=Helicobacter brantae TaxID=375927 RepID=A0A3D8J1V6_9HELI|nr:peptidoglycan DD-metalloendopeptidase family protein [Helicobacter brantae]RDU71186.1 hypothetical protein CQA58_03480 [Helicobacter brantae]
MLKRFVYFSCCLVCAFGLNSIDKDIQKNQAKIQKTIKEQNRINAKIQKLGEDIAEQNNQINVLVGKIQVLEKEIEDNQARFSEQQTQLKKMQEQSKILQDRDIQIQKQITTIITQELAFRVIANRKQLNNPEDLILEDLFHTLSKNVQNQITSLTQEKRVIGEEIIKISSEILELQSLLKEQTTKREQYSLGIKKRNTMIAKFQKDMETYNQKLTQIARERENLDEILQKLNIKKFDMEEKAKKQALAKQESKKSTQKLNAPLEVKQLGSSYRKVSTIAYKGKKTIAPLDNYRIEQRFGEYFDPVYKLKVFNESLVLSPQTPNANVKNVLDGKVVFAKNTPMLKKVVIIEHANSMHTIYAHLDKIAPTVRPGLRVPKGYVIGKVDDKLNFEVTLKDRHINPLELIKR